MLTRRTDAFRRAAEIVEEICAAEGLELDAPTVDAPTVDAAIRIRVATVAAELGVTDRTALGYVPPETLAVHLPSTLITEFAQPDAKAAAQVWDQVRYQLAQSFPKIGPLMDDAKVAIAQRSNQVNASHAMAILQTATPGPSLHLNPVVSLGQGSVPKKQGPSGLPGALGMIDALVLCVARSNGDPTFSRCGTHPFVRVTGLMFPACEIGRHLGRTAVRQTRLGRG